MGGKSKAPPPPDYSGIAAASEKSAEYSFALGKEQLAWAKEQYAKDSEVIGRIVDDALQRAEVNDAAALRDRQRYEEIYQPLEEQLAQDALDYSTPERREYEAGRASATVAENFESARRAAARNLESFGVDPTSTRYAALDLGTRVQQAAAQAGAENQSRQATDALGRAMRSEAINVGRGYPGQIAGTYATALQSGNSAANSTLANTATGASTMGTGTQWTGTGNQALGTWTNALNSSYNNQIAQFNANQQASSGFGGLLGAGLGFASNAGWAFEEGGAVPEVTPGGNVPPAASPTRGAALDDVDAKLTAGEFVMPRDVVQWKGEEFFQKIVEQSRKAKPEAPAQPRYAISAPSAPEPNPTFVSRPTRGALPVE